jgi:hypothetical protein
MWQYGSPGKGVVFDFRMGREGEGPKQFLGNFHGLLQTDGYKGYNHVGGPKMVHACCLAHARRKYVDAVKVNANDKASAQIIALMDELFAIDREAREQNLDHAQRNALRQELAPELLERLRTAALALKKTALPKSAAGQAACLASQGTIRDPLMRLLDRPEKYPRSRRLYCHQEDSVLASIRKHAGGARPAIIVTAGTGAGKTESFLLPVLNDLFTNPRKPGESGVRAIFLYPMNALVNDQVERLNAWLKDQPDAANTVKFLHFTSETPEDAKALNRSPLANVPRNPSRLMTREEGRENPPDILITNYSMLEYMLCRPQDAPFFGSALRAFVLDEVHLYGGTLAADICLLLRRVLIRCGVESDRVLQHATSATLGGDESELRAFGASIFSKTPSLVHSIYGRPHRRELPAPAAPERPLAPAMIDASPLESMPLLDAEKRELIASPATAAIARACVAPLVASSVVESLSGETVSARILHRTLSHSPIVHALDEFFWQQSKDGYSVIRLRDVMDHLFPGIDPTFSEKSTIPSCSFAPERATKRTRSP